MAGLGRRTHYRKHLTDSVLHDLPEPQKDERIAKVMSTRGSNQFDIIVSTKNTNTNNDTTSNNRLPQLAILPTKFHKLVWVKRNDYVIVRTGIEEEVEEVDSNQNTTTKGGDDNEVPSAAAATTTTSKEEDDDDVGGIRFMITHILYKDQIKHLQTKGLWPINDPEFEIYGKTNNNNNTNNMAASMTGGFNDNTKDDDGIVYNTGYGYNDDDYYDYDDDEANNNNIDDDLFVNTNRIARLEVRDSSSSSSSDDDDE